jgi:mono/diheme cytochrome c family protein
MPLYHPLTYWLRLCRRDQFDAGHPRGKHSGMLLAVALVCTACQLPGVTSRRAAAQLPAEAVGTLVAGVSADQYALFERDIRPLLLKHCIQCHGDEKQEGNLRLDSHAALLAGGDSGAAIARGAADDSLLISAVRHDGLEMPPKKRLSDEEIESLERWINAGAVWPEAGEAGLTLRNRVGIDAADRHYWAFQPLAAPAIPDVSAQLDASRVRNEIDAFIVDRQATLRLSLAPEAEQVALLRRAYFDLVGVPPTPLEIEEYTSDTRADAYERLLDRLLDDPRYGERWARHWLDLVRYAESDGFKQDAYRPTAYLYRDYVIKAFNDDRPYDQFVAEQLAGDEIAPDDPDALAATGYLRHWIYEYNQRDVRTQWSNILNDLTDVTGEVFLGLGLGCARCHDHKFDPLLQRDYFRLQAAFAAFLPRDSALAGSAEELREYWRRQDEWEAATASIRSQMEELEREVRQRTADKAIDKFPPDVRPLLRRMHEQREPYEHQIADLAYRQITEELVKLEFTKTLKGEAKERWDALKAELDQFEHLKPKRLPSILAASDVGPTAPPTRIQPSKPDSANIEFATLEVLGADELVPVPPAHGNSTGRRTALAAWINRPDNPLSHRVLVNRVWQYHFGRGLVSNASDFGRLGEPPTHPELLDFLAGWWLNNGRSLKSLHRFIMTSSTYRQAARHPQGEHYATLDHENRNWWRFPGRRLDAEQVRDAMLVASGSMNPASGGPAADHQSRRRTIYTKVMRNTQDPLLSVLDGPDGSASVARRNVTTTAVQSLLLANSPWPVQLAQEMAARLRQETPSSEDQIRLAYLRTFSRTPTPAELQRAVAFLDDQQQRVQPLTDARLAPEQRLAGAAAAGEAAAGGTTGETAQAATGNTPATGAGGDGEPNVYEKALADFCHVLLNSSEFLYID